MISKANTLEKPGSGGGRMNDVKTSKSRIVAIGAVSAALGTIVFFGYRIMMRRLQQKIDRRFSGMRG